MAEKQFDNVKINVGFSEEQELKELNSGEGLSVLMGKLAKAVKELIAHLADNVRHVTASERANWNGKANGSHGHSAAEISGLPSSLPANGGNADTVDGLHGWQFGTLNADGDPHGTAFLGYCQHNLFGDGRFGFWVENHETRVHYATNADHAVNSDNAENADTLGGNPVSNFAQTGGCPSFDGDIDTLIEEGSYYVGRSYTQNYPDGVGEWGILHVYAYGSVRYQTLMTENGEFSYRSHLLLTPWSNWQRLDKCNGGNADTVDGTHAWEMQTLSADGGTHGSGGFLLRCRHNSFGDGRFGFLVANGFETRTDYATNADHAVNSDNADMLDGLHADSFAPASHGHAAAEITGLDTYTLSISSSGSENTLNLLKNGAVVSSIPIQVTGNSAISKKVALSGIYT